MTDTTMTPPPPPPSWGETLDGLPASPAAHAGATALDRAAPAAERASFSPQDWGADRRPGRLYMTSELRAATGLPRTHLDFYLREGIVRPTARTESGYLLFDEAELTTLRTVLRWRHDGLGIKQIRERLGR